MNESDAKTMKALETAASIFCLLGFKGLLGMNESDAKTMKALETE